MPKYYKILKAKDGELRAKWSRAELYNNPDICYAWGKGSCKSDSHLLHNVLSSPRIRSKIAPAGGNYLDYIEYGPSFYEELESRGYDLTTLKFSIQKKK